MNTRNLFVSSAVFGLLLMLVRCSSDSSDSAPAGADGPTERIASSDTAHPQSTQENTSSMQEMHAADTTTQPIDQDSSPTHTNRLIDETSPYLLQHAHNPVDWYPWGEEAFAAARAQDKPIFLSVGYSTCHWCHVMERESFENEDVAKLMNENFICIKVDREERPDVDDIYMTAVQLQSGRGGWPMSVFMEPGNLQPFFGGTYFPREPRGGSITFPELLRRISSAWNEQRDQLEQQASQFGQRIAEMMAEQRTPRTLALSDIERATALLLSSYDSKDGGFGGGQARAPKFPMPTNIDFIRAASWDNPTASEAAIHTLDRMAMGGMYDHVGGGFHRYSTDAQWLVPHFEKMLYDNGQLASTYADAYEQTSDSYYAQVVRETLDYVLREMTGENGGFYSAQDAEVNEREGQNYLWREAEVRHVLEVAGLGDDVEFALDAYGVSKGTNFQDPHHPEDGRFNVLYLAAPPADLAASHDMSVEQLWQRLDRINEAMLAARATRDQPGLDDKILTGWNGLMIAGMADGGRALDEQRYIDAAARAALFILDNLRDNGSGRLLRTYRNGEARIDAFMEDYAFMVHGLLALHEATGASRWLETAVSLAKQARGLFWDDEAGGYFDTLADQSDLFVRVKSTYDGAVPSGMGIMVNNLLMLHERSGDPQYLDDAVATLRSLSAQLAANPVATIVATRGLHRYLTNHDAAALRGDPIAIESSSEIVSLSIMEDREALSDEVVARFDLKLMIKTPWHINAHEPGDESLTGLSIELVGVQGLAIDVTYPEGESFDGPVGGMRVYSGSVTVPVTVRQTGQQMQGQPQLVVKWQACDDTVCREPEQQVLNLQGSG